MVSDPFDSPDREQVRQQELRVGQVWIDEIYPAKSRRRK
jgi:hypothetical protein